VSPSLKNLSACLLLPLSVGLLLFAWKWQAPAPALPSLPAEPKTFSSQLPPPASQVPLMGLVAAKAKKAPVASTESTAIQAPPQGFSLRGIAKVEGRFLALIESTGAPASSRWLSSGDKLPDGSKIDEIRAERIFYSSPDGSRKELLMPQRNTPR
jgi:hypothetical protein